MILIADSGASKTDWACIKKGTDIRVTFQSQGYNPNYITGDQIVEDIKANLPAGFPVEEVHEIYFYGAGVTELQYPFMEKTPRRVFVNTRKAFIAMDTLASCRALLQSEPGFAAILGTGSNSCLYDGSRIVKNVRSGGFILGDEGGGASLGRMFLSDFIKGLVPEPVASGFSTDFQSDYMTIVANVYKSAAPSAYLGSFAQWLLDKAAADEYVRGLVKANFDAFFTRALMQYDLDRYEVGIVGGFAAAAGNMLYEAAEARGIRISTVCRDISDSLLAFHSGK